MQLTKEQSEIFHKFKTKVSDVTKPHHDDLYLQKWLKARKYDIAKAEKMFRKSMEWRETVGADTILEDWTPPEVIQKYYPGGIIGRDREGNVVMIDPFGQIDLKGIMMSVKKEDIIRSQVYRLEKIEMMRRQQTTKEKPIHQCVHIQDMTGFSSKIMFKAGLNLVLEILDMLEQNYPETLKTTYIINAPRIFNMGYSVIKKFMNKEITDKFRMYTSNWGDEIKKVIDPSQLPKYYGGEMVDDNGDPKCSQMICYGGEVPESCYLNVVDSIPGGNKMKVASISGWSSFTVQLVAPTNNCVIRYSFCTETDGDVTFTILQDVLGVLKPLPPGPRKVTCGLTPEDGITHCPEIGQYVLRFENSSIYSSKKLHYFAEVLDVESEKGAASSGDKVVHL